MFESQKSRYYAHKKEKYLAKAAESTERGDVPSTILYLQKAEEYENRRLFTLKDHELNHVLLMNYLERAINRVVNKKSLDVLDSLLENYGKRVPIVKQDFQYRGLKKIIYFAREWGIYHKAIRTLQDVLKKALENRDYDTARNAQEKIDEIIRKTPR